MLHVDELVNDKPLADLCLVIRVLVLRWSSLCCHGHRLPVKVAERSTAPPQNAPIRRLGLRALWVHLRLSRPQANSMRPHLSGNVTTGS